MECIKLPRVNFQNSDSNCSFMVDRLLGLKSTLKPVDAKLFAYGGKKPLPLLENFQAKVLSSEGKTVVADFYVAKYASGCSLSFNIASQLIILQILNAVSRNREQTEAGRLVSNFSEVFKGIVKLKGRTTIVLPIVTICFTGG